MTISDSIENGLTVDDLCVFLDNICIAKKKMKNLVFRIELHDQPKEFIDSDKGQNFLQKLDLASSEWKLKVLSDDFLFSDYFSSSITHDQYRNKKAADVYDIDSFTSSDDDVLCY